MTHDRVMSDEFPTTQDFLAHMLGAHRPSITVAVRQLQEASLITTDAGTCAC